MVPRCGVLWCISTRPIIKQIGQDGTACLFIFKGKINSFRHRGWRFSSQSGWRAKPILNCQSWTPVPTKTKGAALNRLDGGGAEKNIPQTWLAFSPCAQAGWRAFSHLAEQSMFACGKAAIETGKPGEPVLLVLHRK